MGRLSSEPRELEGRGLTRLFLSSKSLRLSSLTSSNTLSSASKSLPLTAASCLSGNTVSPGLYFFPMSSFSFAVFVFPGFACKNISSRVLTVALCLASRTDPRHDGHVNCGDLPELGGFEACHENHSLRQD